MTKKFTILFALTTFIVLGLAQTVLASSLDGTLLKLGSTGANVVQLQTELNYLGYNVGAADGIFGVKTQVEVVTFQKAKYLGADGIVGSITANALNSAYSAMLHTDKANALISTAKKYIGVPYQWGGDLPAPDLIVQALFSMSLPKTGSHCPESRLINRLRGPLSALLIYNREI